MSGSISFDRVADVYDTTRVTDEREIAQSIDLLEEVLPDGTALEIGVGTGAIAIPFASRGRRVVGVDLSLPMLAKLRAKGPPRDLEVVPADATRLPFRDGTFAGAYCRWVLHLIEPWADAVRELCRVLRRPATVVIEPGGYSGEWRTVWLRFVEELGPAAEPIGLDLRRNYTDLDEVFASCGGGLREMASKASSVDSSLERFFAETAERMYSWTWRSTEEELRRAIDVVRAWAIERYGPDLTQRFEPDAPHLWRVYDLGN
jgi:ubiquinone/menaquinone biosynthesis C-methylase UbiE